MPQGIGENAGRHHVVGIEKLHPFGLHMLQAGLSRTGRTGSRFGQNTYVKGGIVGMGFGPLAHHVEGVVGGIVVDDNQGQWPYILCRYRIECARHKMLAVVHRNDDCY